VYFLIHIKIITVKAILTFTRIYPLLKSGRLSVNTELTLCKALIRPIVTHSCLVWEFAVDTRFLKLQHPQDKVFCTIGNLPRCTPTHDLLVALKIPYIYDFITNQCRQQAKVVQNHENVKVCNISQGKAQHRKYKRLQLGGGQAYEFSSV
jgi:hypothetical protein